MARVILSFLSLLIIVVAPATFASAAAFIEDLCNTTPYPKDCVASVGDQAADIGEDQIKLVKEALTKNLGKTQDLKYSMSHMAMLRGLKANEHAALKDCLDQVDDGEDELRKSIEELNVLGSSVGQDFDFRMSNVKTWVSSVLTDYEACADGFSQPSLNGKTKDVIGPKLEELERVTSNALALINHVPIKN